MCEFDLYLGMGVDPPITGFTQKSLHLMAVKKKGGILRMTVV
jgi:hypothetical protein